jgi:O-antigen/teichoic acid export membrane protein
LKRGDENIINANKQIKLGALMSYFTIAFNIVAGLIYTPWMVGQIGQADYGLYTLAISFISLFAPITAPYVLLFPP